MNLDQLKARFSDERACRNFFEAIVWRNGRRCPHCDCETTYFLSGPSSRPGSYECGQCKWQKLGGAINVESRVGKGARFDIALPRRLELKEEAGETTGSDWLARLKGRL